MKVSVVGGGPAGLYFAAMLKKHRPETKLTIYEAQNESVNALGLGYTLQHLNLSLLAKLDSGFHEALFGDQPTPLIKDALFKTNYASRTLPFGDGFSVTRYALIQYLTSLCLARGVMIKEEKMTSARIEALQKRSDLVVGADGMASLVRQSQESAFQPRVYSSDLRYSWFVNESEQVRREACFYAFQTPEGVVLFTSYPLTLNKQVVIIEMTEACLKQGRFADQSPAQAEGYLNDILSSNGDLIQLTSAGLPWYTSKTNAVKTLYSGNSALIGDAAFAFHYSAGQGVTTAFSMGYTLVQCLLKQKSLQRALSHYSHSLRLALAKPLTQSIAHVKWFEGIDRYFQAHDTSDWLDLFLEKGPLKVSAKRAAG